MGTAIRSQWEKNWWNGGNIYTNKMGHDGLMHKQITQDEIGLESGRVERKVWFLDGQ